MSNSGYSIVAGSVPDTDGESVIQKHTDGGTNIYGLARSSVRVSAGVTYNATEILGYRVLLKGTGTLTLSPVSGVTDIVVTAAELTAAGDLAYAAQSEHLDSLTAGTGMEVLVYIPS